MIDRAEDKERIAIALEAARALALEFTRGTILAERKADGEPVTALDRAIDQFLRRTLPESDEGWLSEESADDSRRLAKRRVWIVDPLDGTKEFLAGLPEWCVSIGLVEDGRAVAGGICNPTTGETFIGSRETGLQCLRAKHKFHSSGLRKKPVVLASRSEFSRGEWDWLRDAPFEVRPVGSIAYKLALVAAGCADATWTFVPKSEWDVAAGVALVEASGGSVRDLDGEHVVLNRPVSKMAGLVALGARSQRGVLARTLRIGLASGLGPHPAVQPRAGASVLGETKDASPVATEGGDP